MKCNKVVDIHTYTSIDNSKEFFLDTNVLYWYTNPRFASSEQLRPQAKVYYNFVDQLTSAGNPLITSIYNLTELLNVIEKNEFEIYAKMNPEIEVTRKDFRRMEDERKKVKQIMRTALNNVNEICNIIEFKFDYKNVGGFVESLMEHQCDVFDYLILMECVDKLYLNVISDDNDYSTMSKINLYTANEKALNI